MERKKIVEAVKELNKAKLVDEIDIKMKETELKEAFMQAIEAIVDRKDEKKIPEGPAVVYNALRDEEDALKAEQEKAEQEKAEKEKDEKAEKKDSKNGKKDDKKAGKKDDKKAGKKDDKKPAEKKEKGESNLDIMKGLLKKKAKDSEILAKFKEIYKAKGKTDVKFVEARIAIYKALAEKK